MDRSAFKKVDLFGGAITVKVPAIFEDVSDIRQVPDNQEVYLSSTSLTSLIFDLSERVSHTPTDEAAIRYHLEDIVDDDHADGAEIYSLVREGIQLGHLPPSTPALTLLATITPKPSPQSSSSTSDSRNTKRPNAAISTTIFMGLIRLVDQSTDVVVTLNIPRQPSESGKAADDDEEEGEEEKRIMEEVWRTFEVRDWELFGTG